MAISPLAPDKEELLREETGSTQHLPAPAPAPVQSPPVSRHRKAGSATAALHRPRLLIFSFLTPALLLYAVFFVFPMARAILLSFFKGSPASSQFIFVSGDNYRKLLLDDPSFLNALWHNFLFLVAAGSVTLVLALAIAVGLTRIGRGKNTLRVVFLFPNVMPVVATAILWSFIFNPSFGILNSLLRLLRLEQFCHAWLGEPRTALPALMAVQIWGGVGFYIMLFYAALLRIPADYLDAARIDGANGWQEFRHVILPLLSELLKVAVIYVVINALNVFGLVFLVTEGTPDRHVDVTLTYLYEQAFQNGNFGYACAIGVLQLLILLTLAGLVSRVFRRDVVEL